MTFRLRHDFKDGASILGMQLATCMHCETLRVTLPNAAPHFIRRAKVESERVRDAEPPCTSPALHFRAPW